MEVVYWFRNKRSGGHSIEHIFQSLGEYMRMFLKVDNKVVPASGAGILSITRNLVFAIIKSKSVIHHITGDIHYLTLAYFRGPVVLTIHDCVVLDKVKSSPIKFQIFLYIWYKIPIWKADVVTTISQKSKDEIIAYAGCPPDKIKVIPNFVFPNFLFNKKVINVVCPRILHVGTTSNKNLLRLIHAIEGLSCVLEIIGHLEETTKHLLESKKIEFENYYNISAEMMIERYQKADIVSFASTYEGFGMPIIEAQATGRPVVTSNIEPMISVAGGGGACLVDPFDIAGIRAGILRVIEDEEYRNSLICNGFENVKRYQLSHIAQQYLKIYQQLYK